MRRVAYLQSPNTPEILKRVNFLDELGLLRPHFAELGYRLEAVDWRDASVNWRLFEFVIPKCAWDYFNHYPEFVAWLDRVNKLKIEMRNPIALIQWNMHKRYLLEMQGLGAAIAPLTMLSRESDLATIDQLFKEHPQILLKPAVSGGGKQTQVYQLAGLADCHRDAQAILRDCPVIAQPYFAEVAQGEWSFFFFGGGFSHAIAKIPKAGDFRAHALFGAVNQAAQPSAGQIAEAKRFLEFLPLQPRYARVDGIYVDGRLLLIELELIEPYLYFECAPPEAPRRFAEAMVG